MNGWGMLAVPGQDREGDTYEEETAMGPVGSFAAFFSST